jgi:hypothetical protein
VLGFGLGLNLLDHLHSQLAGGGWVLPEPEPEPEPKPYITFTLSSIAGGVWVFNEAWRPASWRAPVPKQEYLFFAGCLVAFVGV